MEWVGMDSSNSLDSSNRDELLQKVIKIGRSVQENSNAGKTELAMSYGQELVKLVRELIHLYPEIDYDLVQQKEKKMAVGETIKYIVDLASGIVAAKRLNRNDIADNYIRALFETVEYFDKQFVKQFDDDSQYVN
jgi:hypothetical protein